MYTKGLFLFALAVLLVNSQLITSKRIKSSFKNTVQLPNNLPLKQIANPCTCPLELTRIPNCPCGCPNPQDCKGPIINSFGCPNRACKCGGCKTVGQCRCSESPIIDSSCNFLTELPLQSINLPFSVIEIPFDYPLCGCEGPCQCLFQKEQTCPVINPNYSPVITESYLTPDLSSYRVETIGPAYFEPAFLPCGCPESSCSCRSVNPVYEVFAPVQECPAPIQLSCGCSRQCGCVPPKGSCGVPSCGCPAPLSPVLGCPKYLRQVTIQPPFL